MIAGRDISREEGIEICSRFIKEIEKQFKNTPDRKTCTLGAQFAKDLHDVMMKLSWYTPLEKKGMSVEERNKWKRVKLSLEEVQKLPLESKVWLKENYEIKKADSRVIIAGKDALSLYLKEEGKTGFWYSYPGYGKSWEIWKDMEDENLESTCERFEVEERTKEVTIEDINVMLRVTEKRYEEEQFESNEDVVKLLKIKCDMLENGAKYVIVKG